MATHVPLELTVRDIPKTPTIQERIEKKTEKLGQYFEKIEYCKVFIDAPQKHKLQGRLFNVRIEVGVPGKKLVTNHIVSENLYAVIRDAFAAIVRQLENYRHKQRGDVKSHESPTSGHIVRLFSNYGFISSLDGHEYYFQADHVLGGHFRDLKPGTRVHFLQANAGDGVQAQHVSLTNGKMR